MAQNDRLTANQIRALKALLSSPTIAKAAKAAGVSERTLYRYLNNQTFKDELRQRQGEILTATTSALVGMSGEAVAALRAILDDPEASASVKARVGLGWLGQMYKSTELDNLLERLSQLEAMANERNK